MNILRPYKRYTVAAIAFMLLLALASCGKGPEKVAGASNAANRHSPDKFMQNLAKPDQQMVSLLAIKYGAPRLMVENLLDGYLSKTDYNYRNFKRRADGVGISTDTSEDPSWLNDADENFYTQTISSLSTQTKVSPATAASIIFDYLTWEAAQVTCD